MSLGGFSPLFSSGIPLNQGLLSNPVSPNIGRQQADAEMNVAKLGQPGPIANAMGFGQKIGDWSDLNPDPMNGPDFLNAFNAVFGPGQNQIGGPLDPTTMASMGGMGGAGGGSGLSGILQLLMMMQSGLSGGGQRRGIIG